MGIVLSAFLLASLGGTQGFKDLSWMRNIHELALTSEVNSLPVLKADEITYNLVDTSLALLQLGKYVNYLGYDGALTLFDWVYDFSRVNCSESCVQQNVHVEFREPAIYGAELINVTTNVTPTRLNFSLIVPDLFISSPGYRHTITNNVTAETKIGEFAYLSILNTKYGIAADYQLVADVGIQLSNVSLTLEAEMSWTVEQRYTILANGFVIDDGFKETSLSDDLMNLWNGDYEGQPLKPQYEQWAQYVLNCGLSGGKSDPSGCADVQGSKGRKFSDFAAAL
ncbi:hypothetical protein Ocin01_11390 [Orchesella cincta]|uniref:Uncharacterized protein n=1 Tax=Orchesella cincta TaxID=48709 RepID=A0A1D2MQH7_ORCCI|nr:hypothetical protein Ocin01_11390 [Orchesella cincta]